VSAPLDRVSIRDVTVTRLGLGSAPLGGLFTEVSDDAAAATVARAWDLGLRFFDTAPLYGYGNAERRLGAVLRERDRSAFALETKVGRLLRVVDDPTGWDVDRTQEHEGQPFYRGTGSAVPVFDFSYDAARRSLEESLERLGLDRVDIALVHDPDDHVEIALDGACRALVDLRDQGVVGAVGVGIDHSAPAERFVREADIDCVLIAGRWTLLDDDAGSNLLPAAVEHGVHVIAAGVFNSGVLADAARGCTFDYITASDDVVARAMSMARVCARHGVPLKAAALQHPFRHPAVSAVVVGARSPDEIEENVAMAALPLPEALWDDLATECAVWRP
jgi:D-threo-aldose 1-dehydrogenase